MVYHFCPLCNKFTVDESWHQTSCIHTKMDHEFRERFGLDNVPQLIFVDDKMYPKLMTVRKIVEVQERTISEHELKERLVQDNSIASFIISLQKSKRGLWDQMLTKFDKA